MSTEAQVMKEEGTMGGNSSVTGQLAALEGLVSPEFMNQMRGEAETQAPVTHQAQPVVSAPVVEAPVVENRVQNTSAEPATENTSSSSLEVESPIFGGKKVLNAKKEDAIPDEVLGKLDPDALKEFIKPFGLDDPNKLKDAVNKWRSDAQKVPEIQGKIEKYEKVWNEMPEDIFEAIHAWGRGEDYRKVFSSRPQLDYTKDAKDVSEQQLVDSYMPGQFTTEEWEEYSDRDGSAAVKKAINMAIQQSQEKFSLDKNKFVNGRANLVKQQTERMQQFEASAKSSVSSLTSALPDVDPSYVSSIERSLVSGGVNSLFYDKDGNLLPDAAIKFSMAQDGLHLLNQIKSQTAHQVETNVNQQILTRSAETVRGKGAAEIGKPGAQAQNYLNSVVPTVKKSTY